MTYEEAIDCIKVNRDYIARNADRDHRCADIVKLHRLHVACPSDPGATGLLIAAVEDFRREEKRKAALIDLSGPLSEPTEGGRA